MKNILLTAIVACASFGWSQCTDLFFSEYVEGTHNNKALEIYNPTGADIDLSNYRIIRWSNGATNSNEDIQYIQPLSGTIAAKGTFIVAVDKRDASAVGADTMLFQDLLDAVNNNDGDFYSPTYGDGSMGSKCIYHNGDDALSLERTNDGSTYTIVDIFGLIGEAPQSSNGSAGAGWTDEPNYWDGNGAYWTKNKTLVRKSSVTSGVTTNPGAPYQSPGMFNPSVEWDSMSVNTFTELGSHTSDCDAMSIESMSSLNDEINIYPNPVQNASFELNASSIIEVVELFDLSGKSIIVKEINESQTIINTRNLKAGVYMLKVSLENKGTATQHLIIK